MLTCKEASHLISQNQDRSLSLQERWGLRIHLWICANCRRFEHQIDLMQRLLHQATRRAEAELADAQLPENARKRIGQAIAEQLRDVPK